MNTSPWTFGPDGGSAASCETVTLVDGSTFMLSRSNGSVAEGGSDGLYVFDTRLVSQWELRLDGRPVEALTVSADGPFGATFVGQVREEHQADASILVIRRRYVGRGAREDLAIRNHSTTPRTIEIAMWISVDFAGLFAVKAGGPTDWTEPVVTTRTDGLTLRPGREAATAVDQVDVRTTPEPSSTGRRGLLWHATIEPGDEWSACIEVTLEAGGEAVEPASRCGSDVAHAAPVHRMARWRASASRISADHAALERALRRSVDDLGALRIIDPEHPERTVVAAGAPWFMTLFGRDSLLTSWMALPVDHDLALGVLAELAETQGADHDPVAEEQPGRILHEVRFDRLSRRLLGGSGRYYGSVDATPLFVMLVGEVAAWIGPDERLAALLPAVDRALAWIETDGDLTGDGFVDYRRSNPGGLEHQGWKDSWDGIRHRDGSVAVAPISLCEVQGYVVAALRARARLAELFGDGSDVANAFRRRADAAAARLDDAFWMPDLGTYAVGLDEHRRPIGSVTSNLGHLLWCGAVPRARAERIASDLASPRMFTGWGVRTLADDAAGYNPLSYHCGSVWPHDTAIAIAGLARYGHHDAAARLAVGLIAASVETDGRLPELFAGFDRDDIPGPVPYPASCSPQAWAAAAPLLVVRAVLGLEPSVPDRRLLLRPRIPSEFGEVRVLDLPLGDARVDIVAREDTADVEVRDGELDIVVR